MIFLSQLFLQKTNKRIRLYYNDTSGRLVVVPFLEEIEGTKKHFEIKWPLGGAILAILNSRLFRSDLSFTNFPCQLSNIRFWICNRWFETPQNTILSKDETREKMYRIGDISTGIKVKPLPSKGLVFLPPILFLENPTALIIVKLVKKKCTYNNSRHQTHWHSYPLQLHHYLRYVNMGCQVFKGGTQN